MLAKKGRQYRGRGPMEGRARQPIELIRALWCIIVTTVEVLVL